MNKLELKGYWNVARGKLKQKFAQLSDDDLQYVAGKEDELMGRIQKITGKSSEKLNLSSRNAIAAPPTRLTPASAPSQPTQLRSGTLIS